jgi:hypothetical protein
MQTVGATARDVEACVQAHQITQARNLDYGGTHTGVGVEFEVLTGFRNVLERHRNMPW